jgi:23S rRNA pseudouridine1911/1915/1917 synthase
MVVAKEAHAQHLLQQLLHTDRFQRTYLAVAQGTLPEPEGCIDLPIAKEDAASIRRMVHPQGKEARTFYRVEGRENGRSLVRLRLDTGRTHQIRVHLSHLGCPICGDFLYGTELDALPGRFALHSTQLRLWHPLKNCWLEAESPLPDVLGSLLSPLPPSAAPKP